jgi:hypothetical protein
VLFLSWQMTMSRVLWATVAASALGAEVGFCAQTNSGSLDFNREVRPILAEHCLACHGQDAKARKGELRLDVREEAVAAGAVVPGKSSESGLIKRVHATDPDEVMPPPDSSKGTPLTPAEMAVLTRWIDEGAAYAAHWAFIPPAAAPVPVIELGAEGGFVRGPVDAFVLKHLRDRNWRPAEPAGRETWLRRVTFDLTGLPPTPGETDGFLADDAPDAFEKVVDRLLASPAYGERLAMDWLDVARYADTYGRHEDADMTVWPYRDWVIRAFNENLPYDQFVTWQTAGDLLPNPTRDQMVATTFNRLAQQSNEAGSNAEEFRIEQVADRVHTNGTAFLGLTMECARCHDHKFDPLTMKDYYSMAAFLNNIDELGLFAVFTGGVPPPSMLLFNQDEESRLAELRPRLRQLEERQAVLRGEAAPRFAAALKRERPPAPATPAPAVAPPAGWWQRLTGFFGGSKPAPAASSAPPSAAPAKPVAFIRFESANDKLIPNDADPAKPAEMKSKAKITAAGRTGHGFHFDGFNAVNIDAVPELHRQDPFSFALWVKPSRVHSRAVVAHRSRSGIDSAMRGFELVLEENRPSFALVHFSPGNEIRIAATQALPVNEWTHLAATYDGSSRAAGLTLYLNGRPAEARVVRDSLYRDIVYREKWGDSIEKDSGRSVLPFSLGARFNDASFTEGTVDDVAFFLGCLSAPEIARLTDPTAPVAEESWIDWWLREKDEPWRALAAELTSVRAAINEIESNAIDLMVMKENDGPRRPTHVLKRGTWNQPGEEVAPETPAALGTMPAEFPRNRLGYARWLTSRQNPLVSRVAVNRLWQMFFGRGLVPKSEDFGTRSPLPSQPDLLDWLAVRFIDGGWDTKALCREIVLSSTYRQDSLPRDMAWLEADPDNEHLARGPRRRLPAEQVRDLALATSGLLVPTLGGPSVRPYQPARLWEESGTQHEYLPSTGDGLYRRSLYTFWRRTLPPPSMSVFDAPSREFCKPRRETTTTPLQSLVLMNDPQFLEAARVLAARLVAGHPASPEARIAEAGRRLTSRAFTAEQSAALLRYYHQELEKFTADPASATTLFSTNGEAPPPDPALPAAEVAATTMVVRLLFNFGETTMKP